MAATGKTPILLYGSTIATNQPAAGNLTNSSDGCEIAINVADKNLFFKDSTNTVNTVPIRQSSASSNGWLSSTDWTTFNNKAPAFTYTSTYIPYGQGTTTPTQSANLAFDGTNLLVGGLVRTNSNAATPAGGIFHLYHAVTDSRSWKFRNDVYAYGDFAIDQSTTQTGSTYATKMYFAPTGGVSVGDTTDAGAGNLRIGTGNLVIGTSGKGIDFSATAGTGTSELLADYEEGTWTPTITGLSSGTINYKAQNGTYTKIGKLVSVQFWIRLDTPSSPVSSGLLLSGLPYTSDSASTRAALAFRGYNLTGVTGIVGLWMNNSSTTANLIVLNNGTTSGLLGSNLQLDAEISATFSYVAA